MVLCWFLLKASGCLGGTLKKCPKIKAHICVSWDLLFFKGVEERLVLASSSSDFSYITSGFGGTRTLKRS